MQEQKCWRKEQAGVELQQAEGATTGSRLFATEKGEWGGGSEAKPRSLATGGAPVVSVLGQLRGGSKEALVVCSHYSFDQNHIPVYFQRKIHFIRE